MPRWASEQERERLEEGEEGEREGGSKRERGGEKEKELELGGERTRK